MSSYPVLDAPYGYRPVNRLGGLPYAGSTREYPIAYNSATPIYYGDPVVLVNGYLTLATLPVNTTNQCIGVFMGCSFTNPVTKQKMYSQFYPGNVLAGDIEASVVDDPDIVLRVAVQTAAGALTIGSVSSLLIGQNVAGGTRTGNPATGNSTNGVVAAAANTASAGFRVLRLVPDTQIMTEATYVSGTGTTSLVVSGLTVGQVIPVGTDVFNVINGQLQFTGSATTASTTVSTTGNTTLTVTASTATVAGTVALVQTPEVLVKWNFGAHRYYVA